MRPVAVADQDAILRLSENGGRTLTTLPADPAFLEKRIKRSIHAFYPEVSEPGNEAYTFVLEDMRDGRLVGISGVFARTGGFEPFYSYERCRTANRYPPLHINQTIEWLECRTWHKGPSEMGSLYLQADARGRGVGKLLSLGRLLFMAAFPRRFEQEVIAEIRGWQDESGRSPFWEGVIRPFFGTAFEKMDAVSGSGDKDFLGALLPKHPIYCNLLPEEVCAVIGRPHREAEPAMRLLLNEGFRATDSVDVFDAGPMIRATLPDLRTSRPQPIQSIETPIADTQNAPSPAGILFRRSLDFRAILTASAPDATGCIHLSKTDLQKLDHPKADELAYYSLT